MVGGLLGETKNQYGGHLLRNHHIIYHWQRTKIILSDFPSGYVVSSSEPPDNFSQREEGTLPAPMRMPTLMVAS